MVVETNPFRTKLEAGEVVLGASCQLFNPTVLEIFGGLGLDYAFMDFEHNGPSIWDSLLLEQLTRTAAVADVEPLVRIPSGGEQTHPSLVRKVLDTGIRNVLVPRVETAAEVRSAVEAARFVYDDGVGDRGAGSARGSDWGAARGPGWVTREDALTAVGVMIENATAVDNIEDIVDVPDLGFVIIGSSDLSISLDRPFDRGDPTFEAAVETVRGACADAGVPFGQMGVGPEEALETVRRGGQILSIGSDVGGIRSGLGAVLDDLDLPS